MSSESEKILDKLADIQINESAEEKKSSNLYSRKQLMQAALFGITELHEECVELLAKHSPFRNHKTKVCE